jgi:hypothetical protein
MSSSTTLFASSSNIVTPREVWANLYRASSAWNSAKVMYSPFTVATEGGGVAVDGTGVDVGNAGVGVTGSPKAAQALNPKIKLRVN